MPATSVEACWHRWIRWKFYVLVCVIVVVSVCIKLWYCGKPSSSTHVLICVLCLAATDSLRSLIYSSVLRGSLFGVWLILCNCCVWRQQKKSRQWQRSRHSREIYLNWLLFITEWFLQHCGCFVLVLTTAALYRGYIDVCFMQLLPRKHEELECGPMPNVMVACRI